LGRDWDGGGHTYSYVSRYVDDKQRMWFNNIDIGWVNVDDPVDVSNAYRHGRQCVWHDDETPKNKHYMVLGPQLGIREGRLIIGEYILHPDDLLLGKRFDDVVMRCHAFYENHAYDYGNESEWAQDWVSILGLWSHGFGGQVPYRCFIPRIIDGLFI